MTKLKFTPGEWAVLRNGNGGRLFEVARVDAPDEDGSCRVWEVERRFGQTGLDIWDTRLVKVEGHEAASALSAVLRHIYQESRSRIAAIERACELEMDRATADFEITGPEFNEAEPV